MYIGGKEGLKGGAKTTGILIGLSGLGRLKLSPDDEQVYALKLGAAEAGWYSALAAKEWGPKTFAIATATGAAIGALSKDEKTAQQEAKKAMQYGMHAATIGCLIELAAKALTDKTVTGNIPKYCGVAGLLLGYKIS